MGNIKTNINKIFCLKLILIALFFPICSYANTKHPVLVISNISDLHAQLEPLYIEKREGVLEEAAGISRLYTAIKKLREKYPENFLLVGSGDYYTEDFRVGKYFQHFKCKATSYFLNKLAFDATTIGNHEFDYGLDIGNKSLQYLNIPIVVSNLKKSELNVNIHKKLIINKNGYKIGIIGLMNPDIRSYGLSYKKDFTMTKSSSLIFEKNIYYSTQQLVNELKGKDKVDFIVALTHLGIGKDKKLAKQVNGIDVICGGHTHTILPSYKEIVINKKLAKRNKISKTIIVHPGDRGLFLGELKLFKKDKNGFFNHEWKLIKIDKTFSQDPLIQKDLISYEDKLPTFKNLFYYNGIIDTSKHNVRTKEIPFANCLVDAMAFMTKTNIVMVNAGGIRGRSIFPAGYVTTRDLNNWFPWKDNNLIKLRVKGIIIKQALELGVQNLPNESKNLLHVSGLVYHVNIKNKKGNKIIYIGKINPDGETLTKLDLNKAYDIVITKFMRHENSKFSMFKNITKFQSTNLTDKGAIEKYFLKNDCKKLKIGKRIIFVK